MVRTIDLPDQNHASAQLNDVLWLEDGHSIVKDEAAGLDITNWLPIRMMQRPNPVMLCVLRRGEVFRRMKLKLHDITNLLPIKIMHRLSSIMLCVGKGRVIVKDEVEAARHYKLAANQNHVSAQKCYAVCFANGRGVTTNEAEIARCFELAADQNHQANSIIPSALHRAECAEESN
jgi:TPR repeat protein